MYMTDSRFERKIPLKRYLHSSRLRAVARFSNDFIEEFIFCMITFLVNTYYSLCISFVFNLMVKTEYSVKAVYFLIFVDFNG